MNPLLLPPTPHWDRPEDVARYALACFDAVGLDGWHFAWDRAIRRLGCCRQRRKQISLSIYFVQKHLDGHQEQIRRTLLHETAHALAWEFNQTSGHDATWHAFCAKLGIADEKSRTACEDFAPEGRGSRRRRPLYVLYHKETGRIYHYYTTTPRTAMRRIKSMYIRGEMEETLGKLGIHPYSPADAPKG